MLTFAIPTWNRCNELRMTVHSIAEQIEKSDFPVRILISDNASDDRTQKVIAELRERFPFIDTIRRDNHGTYADSFKTVLEGVKTEWCWFFGDDDYLMPGALAAVWEHIVSNRVDFICACTDVRATGINSKIGTLFDLCNDCGFLDTIGFMSSCIFKIAPVQAACADPSWEVYAQSAFVHSCSFLDKMASMPAMILDLPLVGNQEDWSDETGDRWGQEKIFEKFYPLDDMIRHLWYKGCLPGKIKIGFLRYHVYSVIDKLLSSLLIEYHTNHKMMSDSMWGHVSGLADFIDDQLVAKQIRIMVNDAKRLCVAHQAAVQSFTLIDEQFRNRANQQNDFVLRYDLTNP